MLNETWLKKSVKDSELFPVSTYKIFRIDRSLETHPPYPKNHSKYRKNGGGVLMAIRRDLDIVSTKVEYKPAAELLGVTLKFSDGSKIILCSYYRVGNLGTENHNEFKNYIKNARSRRGVSSIVVACDINMPDVDWQNFSSPHTTDQLFLDTFSNFELEQLIDVPTHTKGNTLDLLLSDKAALISDISVSGENLPCKSDHFCLQFCLKSKFKRLRLPKVEVYNYKRANWNGLNTDLSSINWSVVLEGDMEKAWSAFKHTLFSLMDKHIPKIKVGGNTQPPWFDSEVHHLCRNKERLHSVYIKIPLITKPNLNLIDTSSSLMLEKLLKISFPRKWVIALKMMTILAS